MTSPLGGLPRPPLTLDSQAWAGWFSTVQKILQAVSSSGPSTSRPTTNLYIGQLWFDTTLGYPVVWTGTAWVALGSATVSSVDSITGNGAGTPIQLVNDLASPGNTKFYGSNNAGTRGWLAQVLSPDTYPEPGTIWDDEFDVGSVIDTTGSRFSGANPWTLFGNAVAGQYTASVAGGNLSLSGNVGFTFTAAPVFLQTAPSYPWTMTIKASAFNVFQGQAVGMIVYNSGNNRTDLCGFLNDATSNNCFYVQNGTLTSGGGYVGNTLYFRGGTWPATSNNMATPGFTYGYDSFPQYLRIRSDGTSLFFDWSIDGCQNTWRNLYTDNISSYILAVTHVGIFAGNGYMNVDWFRRTA